MMSSLWAKFTGVLVMVIGLLGAALLYTGGQRDRAREAASRAKAEAKSTNAALEAERAIDTARVQARESSNEVQSEADDRPATDRPDGSFRR